MSYWLAIGPAENWEIGIKKKVWGVTPRHSKAWGQVEPGDTVFFYAMAPVKGLIGYGVVSKTKIDEKPFWPQEISEKHSYWPFRISFEEMQALARKDWEAAHIATSCEGIVFQRAFQAVNEKRGGEWIKAVHEAMSR
jgi:hypothetical protein